jgi:hypothetical protein
MFIFILNSIPQEIIISFFLGYILTPKRNLLNDEPFAGFLYNLKLAIFFLPFVTIINYVYPLLKET